MESIRDNAYVHINLLAKNDAVSFEIINNFEVSNSENSAGIGLENLKQRLRLIYPNRHTLDITESAVDYKTILQIELK